MNENKEFESNEFESICDKVRFAVMFENDLTEEMEKHLLECDECRTSLEQSKKMLVALGQGGVDTLVKNGKSVADSVMEEVGRQRMFAGGNRSATTGRRFKHFGLVAACVVIAVMAAPFLNRLVGDDKLAVSENMAESAVVPRSFHGAGGASFVSDYDVAVDEEASQDMVLYSAHSETAEENDVIDGAPMMLMGSRRDVAEGEAEKSFKQNDEDYVNDWSDTNSDAVNGLLFGSVYEGNRNITSDSGANAKGVILDMVYDSIESGEEYTSDDILSVAYYGAVMYCKSDSMVVKDSVNIIYNGDMAYAVFNLVNDEKITVLLSLKDGKWMSTGACDGDITE